MVPLMLKSWFQIAVAVAATAITDSDDVARQTVVCGVKLFDESYVKIPHGLLM